MHPANSQQQLKAGVVAIPLGFVLICVARSFIADLSPYTALQTWVHTDMAMPAIIALTVLFSYFAGMMALLMVAHYGPKAKELLRID